MVINSDQVNLEAEVILFMKMIAPEPLLDIGTIAFLCQSGLIHEKTARPVLIKREYLSRLRDGEKITDIIDDIAFKYKIGTVSVRNYLRRKN